MRISLLITLDMEKCKMNLTAKIALFTIGVCATIGMFVGGFYLMVVYIPPAVEAFVKAFAQ